MSHRHQCVFIVEDFRGIQRDTIFAKDEHDALKRARSLGIYGPIISPYGVRWDRYLTHLEWLDRKIAMKPPIDFSLLGSMH